ncbi:malignant fibrous histiocytoma-amplified sequence 1 homolog [Acipenser ruthenus]|uniref:malignant fibrous histiocytoma-amplified sequence 1 homolog n=1 Tax=Acipenser ruthenus TaxID=7906 RepID=UPI00145A9D6C|nr:malignant fibrous histiocytoma-amplified sequence 1 homolog [Acipenser ruthenus]
MAVNKMAHRNGPLQEKTVNRSKEKLKVLPQEILEDVTVVQLILERNRLKNISGIKNLINLKTLNLSRNDLVDFPVEIAQLVQLETLYLNQNKIQTIPDGIFNQLQQLKFLKLSTNHLSKIPSDLGCCKSLQYLNLSHNSLKDLPEVVLELQNLKELFVEYNRLRELPAKLFENQNLEKFSAASNRLREPPDEVCAGGLKQIRSYFSQLRSSEADYVKRVKTMFLGSSMAGKSTLCKSLKQKQTVAVDVKDRTVGIEISEMKIEDFRFLFWDFAGQEEYYLTHHVFITPQALVILVIDLASYRTEDTQFNSKVGFWINNILMRVPDSVVLPVGTHVDQCGVEDVRDKKEDIQRRIQVMLDNRKKYLERRMDNLKENTEPALFSDQSSKLDELTNYNLQVLDLIPIDCTNYKDIDSFQHHILTAVQDKNIFPNVEKKLPHIYQAVESTITNLIKDKEIPDHGIVSVNEMLSGINHNGSFDRLAQDDLKDILRYLHRIGLIMWYEESTRLVGTVFVKPSFLITLFKMIVRHDLVEQLQSIPRTVLMGEHAFMKDKERWASHFQTKAILYHKAMVALTKNLLQQMDSPEVKDIAEEIIGGRNEKGKLFSLLEHFEIFLALKPSNPLNPEAKEFKPGGKWEQKETDVPSEAYLFPSSLNGIEEVSKWWGEDQKEDLCVRIYFLPEIPQGFFHRVIIKACSFFTPHVVGSGRCHVVSNGKQLLIKENKEDDQNIEIRCRRPGKDGFRFTWDFILSIISKIRKLLDQWPGLYHCLRSPCPFPGCKDDFDWPDMEETAEIYDMVKDEISTCCRGHNHPTELLFPKAPSAPESKEKFQNLTYITNNGNTAFGPTSMTIHRQSLDS